MALPSYLSPYGQQIFSVACCDEGCNEEIVRFGRSVGTRQILCSWLDRINLINNIGSYGIINQAGQYQYFAAPSYPDAPNLLYFDSLKTEGIPIGGLNVGPNGMVGYALARIVITFKTNPYLELDQGVLAIDYAIQDLELPTNLTSFYFNGNTSDLVDSSQIPAIQGTFVTYTWTQFNLASIPTATISAACAAPIDQSGLFGTDTSNGGTLRLMGVKTNRRVAQTGQEMWDMTTQLVENPFGWNQVFWPTSQGGADTFTPVKSQAGNYPIPLDMAGNIPALVPDIGY